MHTFPACFRRDLSDRCSVRGVYFHAAADSVIPRSAHWDLWSLTSENFLRKDLQYSHFQVNITQNLLKVMTMKDKKLFEAAETDSVLEALYWLCSESESFQNPNLMSDYEQLGSILEQFPEEQSTRITDLIYHLCKEHEKVGFIVGVSSLSTVLET